MLPLRKMFLSVCNHLEQSILNSLVLIIVCFEAFLPCHSARALWIFRVVALLNPPSAIIQRLPRLGAAERGAFLPVLVAGLPVAAWLLRVRAGAWAVLPVVLR